MARDQLALLIKLEAKKEDKLRLDFIKANQHLIKLEQQLAGIDNFDRNVNIRPFLLFRKKFSIFCTTCLEHLRRGF